MQSTKTYRYINPVTDPGFVEVGWLSSCALCVLGIIHEMRRKCCVLSKNLKKKLQNSAEAERSFSCFRLIHTWVALYPRERLGNLGVLALHGLIFQLKLNFVKFIK